MGDASAGQDVRRFLAEIRVGDVCRGRVASVSPSEMSVLLDDFTDWPLGTVGSLDGSWRRRFSDVAVVGQRVSCEFLQFDTWNGEARLSLRAMQPDPFLVFTDGIVVGQRLSGRVTKLVPFGVFVEVADGIDGLVHLSELDSVPGAAPEGVVQVGDRLTVVVTDVDRERRRLSLSRRQA
ncbi:S1 RNA-binding domain-containing protein [Streptomyces griseorubiginosus]|uniref:S1 RNA-binding domain-containing protein n=1 Tax=Streptomyces griseorubiginosus TaxID=67304 RepID=UPI0036E39B33